MKKLTVSALLAGALVFGTAAGADYYNDLETNSGDPIPIVDIRDGIGFVRASQYSMPFFDIELNAEENFVFSRGGDELCITPGSVTALFNGETVTMPGAPYLEDGELYVPIRFLCDTFDIRLAFSDKTYPEKVTLYAGKDVQPMSGLIGDSFNNWSITIPEGWYYYPDSVDGSTATFNTFNGMRVAIAMIDPADPTSPSSTGLEDYLLRREVFTGADGRKYIVQGEIYSHPTAEARAQLNAVIDSFAVSVYLYRLNIYIFRTYARKCEPDAIAILDFYIQFLKRDIRERDALRIRLSIDEPHALCLAAAHCDAVNIRERRVLPALEIVKLRPPVHIQKAAGSACHILTLICSYLCGVSGRALSHSRLYAPLTLILLMITFFACTHSEPHVRHP